MKDMIDSSSSRMAICFLSWAASGWFRAALKSYALRLKYLRALALDSECVNDFATPCGIKQGNFQPPFNLVM
ncbi:hypothetical protein [Roseateles sp.]|uniref:hypothetical protein n=1 Tax=Roseateles sp. TaxID=1971397 RepID=UPI00286CAC88|nr:hypothetical protein [Roseateles sp.]